MIVWASAFKTHCFVLGTVCAACTLRLGAAFVVVMRRVTDELESRRFSHHSFGEQCNLLQGAEIRGRFRYTNWLPPRWVGVEPSLSNGPRVPFCSPSLDLLSRQGINKEIQIMDECLMHAKMQCKDKSQLSFGLHCKLGLCTTRKALAVMGSDGDRIKSGL